MMRMSEARPAAPTTTIGSQTCARKSRNFAKPQGCVDHVGREETADALPEDGNGDVHQHEGEEEVRDRKADEAEEGRHIVADRILPHGRIDADRHGDASR